MVEEFEKLRKEGNIKEWKKVVKDAVREVAVDEWEDGVRRGKKLGLYRGLKGVWGFEEYLEGVYGKGEVLMARFRSGSAAIGEETRRWGGGGTGVWEEDGVERGRMFGV